MSGDDALPYGEFALGLIRPLLHAVDSPAGAERLLRDLGYAPPAAVTAFGDLGAGARAVIDLVDALELASESDDDAALLEALVRLLVAVGQFLRGLNTFQTSIQQNFQGSNFLAQTDIIAALPRALADYLVVRFVEDHYKTLFAGLLLAGIFDVRDVTSGATPFNVPYRRRAVNWDTLGDFLTDPIATLKANLIVGGEFQTYKFLYFVGQLGVGLGLPVGFETPADDVLTRLNAGTDLSNEPNYASLVMLRLPLLRDPLADLALNIYPTIDTATHKHSGIGVGVGLGSQLEIPLTETLQLTLKVSTNLGDSLGLRVDKDGNFSFMSAVLSPNAADLLAGIQFGVRIALERTPNVDPSRKLLSVGQPGGSRFEIGSGGLALGVDKLDELNLYLEADIKDGLIVIKPDNPDGFLAKILPAEGITANFSLGAGISNRAGLYFTGSSSLLIKIPVHIELGPISIESLAIGVTIEQGSFPVTLGTSLSATLGPLDLVVEDVGLKATITPKGDRSGNLGPLDAKLSFKPPKGVGISVDAGAVTGGGYLFFDSDAGEYAGAVELAVGDSLVLQAIGLITTRMPDGSSGFSMVIIITAQFSPGVQLGWGFTLNGVGGLLGLNRTVVIDALSAGVRSGAVADLLFPTDPVANAPRIISEIKTIFPPLERHFLIGPMAKINWGSPPLITIELGVVLEIPGNIAILGVIRAVLPDEDADVLHLQVNFIGVIEFDKKRAWLFAALYDSRLLFITLEGEMGVLIAVGADANFVVSVGGFHPAYAPPPLPFPTPKRIAFNIANTSYCKIRADAYFAITTNAAMFGAHAQLFFGYDSFSVEGHLSMDALLRFAPFYFIVQVSAGASLKVFGAGIFGIDLDFTLEGTNPWRARGHGTIDLWLFSITKDFDETWGEAKDTSLPPIQLIPLMQAELDKPENWRSLLPTGTHMSVAVRALEVPAGTLVLHPLGVLEFSQRQAPMGFTLTRVGAQKPSDANRFEVRVTSAGLVKTDDAYAPFPPAQFREMTDAQKVSAPAYQPEKSGIDVGIAGGDLKTGPSIQRIVRYQVTTLDTLYRRNAQPRLAIGAALFNHLARGAAASLASVSMARRKQMQPFAEGVGVGGPKFAVGYSADNRTYATGFASPDAANDYMQSEIANDPTLRNQLHVLPSEELAA